MSTAEPKTSPGTVLTDRLNELADYAEVNAAAAAGLGPAHWYRPGDFSGSLLNPLDYHEPFDRRQQEYEFEQAVTGADGKTFGTTTDLALVQLQGDLMACAERAFRARHQTAVRSRIHPTGRLAGHAADTGVIKESMLGYIVALDRLNKSEEA